MHGGDYIASGPEESLRWMFDQMKTACDCKIEVMGPDKEDSMRLKALNRILAWQQTETGPAITYEADPRHAEI